MGTKVTLAFSKVTTYVIYFCILTILTTTTLSITLKHNMPEIILPTISMTENQFPEQFIARFGFVPVGVFFIIFQIVFHWHEIHQPNRKRSLFSSLILNSLLVCGFLCGICLAGQSLFPVSTHWNLNFINWVWETHWDFDTGVHHIFSTSLFFFAFFHMFFAVVYDLFFKKMSWKIYPLNVRLTIVSIYFFLSQALIYLFGYEVFIKKGSEYTITKLHMSSIVEVISIILILLYFDTFKYELKNVSVSFDITTPKITKSSPVNNKRRKKIKYN
ncbi:fasting-inducible integral membrane protein tm6p1-related [Anaeramoeba flamelloides]|uniref:Fasting-inducible integral membrane protein tm6p1-related n=1 Tax=Anaeramoeba flamelloides TaxID=1746091 RepID=A0AAV7YEQ4_9EUKA|nr:fasting-inducible integral membrane protein tm6p1-related [Anaeramoeba flamelloides]